MKREIYRTVVKGLRDYSKTVGQSDHSQANNQNAVYAVQHDNGKAKKPLIHRINYHACFGKMKTYDNNVTPSLRDKKPIAVFIQVQKQPDLPEEALFHYLEWMLNMSPWRHAFVSKSVRKVMKDRVIVVDPDQTSNYMANAMMGARQGWENYSLSGLYKRINLWWDVAQHVNPNIAFVLAHQSLSMFDNTQGQIGSNNHGHTCLPHNEEAIFSFLKEYKADHVEPLGTIHQGYPQPPNPDLPWAERRQYDSEPSKIWRGVTPTINLLADSQKAIKENANDGKRAKVNPFAANTTLSYPRKLIAETFISKIPEWEKQIYA